LLYAVPVDSDGLRSAVLHYDLSPSILSLSSIFMIKGAYLDIVTLVELHEVARELSINEIDHSEVFGQMWRLV
jgi:hypothetical protein